MRDYLTSLPLNWMSPMVEEKYREIIKIFNKKEVKMKKETCVAIYDHVGKSLNYYTLKRFYSPDEEGCYSDENIRAVAKEMGETEKETRRQMTISENEKKLIQKEVKEIETLFDKLTKKLLYVGLDMEPLRIKGDI